MSRCVELFAHEEARSCREDIVPHQSLMVVEAETLEEAHRYEDASREQYGKNQINHIVGTDSCVRPNKSIGKNTEILRIFAP